MSRLLIAAGALAMALGVALGAYSSHAAKGAVHPEAARLLQTAVLYQLVHGIGVLIAGALCLGTASRWLAAAGALHLAGIALFCGGLWFMAFTGQSPGLAAPLGGFAFIGGWLAMAAHAMLKSGPPPARG